MGMDMQRLFVVKNASIANTQMLKKNGVKKDIYTGMRRLGSALMGKGSEVGVNDDLISRSALLAAYDKAHQGPPGGARKLIEEAPEALVRCKDCRYYHGRNEGCGGMGVYPPSGDWFCADGERMDNDG